MSSPTPTALLCVYHFIAPDITELLEKMGYQVDLMGYYEENDYRKVWRYDTRQTLQQIAKKPDFLFTINAQHFDKDGRVARLLTRKKIPHVCWFVDNPFNAISPWDIHNGALPPSPYTHLWVIDETFVAPLRALGYDHVHYVPHGTSPRFFQAQSEEAQCDVSFIGNLGRPISKRLYDDFLNHHPDEKSFAEYVVATQLKNQSTPFDEVFQQCLPQGGHGADIFKQQNFDGRVKRDYLKFHCSIMCREALASALKKLPDATNIHIYGEEDWQEIVPKHWCQGRSYYQTQTPEIYAKSRINLNITHLQFPGAFNQRILDVLAGGNFLITDYRSALDKHFTPGKDIVCFESFEELPSLIQHYLDHPDQRQTIAHAGQQIVKKHYHLESRVKKSLELIHA